MVGVGVAEGGGGPAGGEQYYGEYYAPEQYYVQQEMCPHPQQHPQHPHMCAVHTEYGAMPVVTSAAMMPQMMPAVMDENMRHYLVHASHPPPHPHHAHHQPQHHQAPPQAAHHHQPPLPYNATNGTNGPQHFYNAGYPQHYHVPPHHIPHYQPPPVYQKDERTQRQYSKLKQKFERKYNNRNNGTEPNSGASTPSLSPRKEVNGSRAASSGTRSEGESSSASTSLQGDDDTQALLDLMSATRKPQVSEMTSTSALVQWNSPLPEEVTLPRDLTYELLLGDRGRYKAIYSGPKLSCWVCDLRPGHEYSVCLQIRAGEVTGSASEAVTFTAPAAPPARPAAPRLTARSRNCINLRWPSVHDNGARITHYLVEMEEGDGEWREIAKPRSRQHTASELRLQTRHRFRVAAVNECGQSLWSDESTAWTAGAPPPAPAPPRLEAAQARQLQLAWERRDAHDEYTLQADDTAEPHGFLPVYSGPDDRYVHVGLRRATNYRFRLRCENADGQGPWSSDVTYRTLPERPSPPGRASLRGKAHSRAFRIRWDPPGDDGGANVDTYTLELDDGEGFRQAYTGSDREAHCERLRPGTTYRTRVRCRNEAGDSDWSNGENVATEPAVPGPCSALEYAGTVRSVSTVRWKPPAENGGAPVTEYRVYVADADGETKMAHQGPSTECQLRDLRPGANYEVTVNAVNRVGQGGSSPALALRTPAAPPAAPHQLQVALESPRTATLSWLAPEDNGSPIIDYRLEISRGSLEDAYCEVYRGAATERRVTDLVPFSAYLFRVCACNTAGKGPWSQPKEALTDRSSPAAPAPPICNAETCSLHISWEAPNDHGAALLKYRVRIDDDERILDISDNELTVEGLNPDTCYRVSVAAENELGVGEWSQSCVARTRPPPPTPPVIECSQRAHNYLKLEWNGSPNGNLQYRLEMRVADSKDFRPAYRGPARSFKVKKLRDSTVYVFRIRASDERGGCGEWSEVVELRTSAAPPTAPAAPMAEPCDGHGRVAVRWEGGEERFALQTARAGGAWRDAWSGVGSTCTLEDLECGAEYAVRVCSMRGGRPGAWSASTRVLVPALRVTPRAPRVRTAPRRLAPRHTALLLAVGFLLLAVIVAALLQRLVAPRA